jgi:hypothetical protein
MLLKAINNTYVCNILYKKYIDLLLYNGIATTALKHNITLTHNQIG